VVRDFEMQQLVDDDFLSEAGWFREKFFVEAETS